MLAVCIINYKMELGSVSPKTNHLTRCKFKTAVNYVKFVLDLTPYPFFIVYFVVQFYTNFIDNFEGVRDTRTCDLPLQNSIVSALVKSRGEHWKIVDID